MDSKMKIINVQVVVIGLISALAVYHFFLNRDSKSLQNNTTPLASVDEKSDFCGCGA